MKTADKDLDTVVIENIKRDKVSSVDSKLLGGWKVHLSCDGTIVCNVCPKISFRADGFGTTNEIGYQNVMWELKNDRLKISNLSAGNFVENGEYAMTYTINSDIIELELIEVTNSVCYRLSRVISN